MWRANESADATTTASTQTSPCANPPRTDTSGKGLWIRRSLFTLVALVPLLALFNVFGQRPTTAKATVPAATLSVYAPTTLRGGLLWEARFHITAHQDVKNAILRLGTGWAEGMSMNTIEPSPTGQASHDGQLDFTLGHIPANHSFILYMQSRSTPRTSGIGPGRRRSSTATRSWRRSTRR